MQTYQSPNTITSFDNKNSNEVRGQTSQSFFDEKALQEIKDLKKPVHIIVGLSTFQKYHNGGTLQEQLEALSTVCDSSFVKLVTVVIGDEIQGYTLSYKCEFSSDEEAKLWAKNNFGVEWKTRNNQILTAFMRQMKKKSINVTLTNWSDVKKKCKKFDENFNQNLNELKNRTNNNDDNLKRALSAYVLKYAGTGKATISEVEWIKNFCYQQNLKKREFVDYDDAFQKSLLYIAEESSVFTEMAETSDCPVVFCYPFSQNELSKEILAFIQSQVKESNSNNSPSNNIFLLWNFNLLEQSNRSKKASEENKKNPPKNGNSSTSPNEGKKDSTVQKTNNTLTPQILSGSKSSNETAYDVETILRILLENQQYLKQQLEITTALLFKLIPEEDLILITGQFNLPAAASLNPSNSFDKRELLLNQNPLGFLNKRAAQIQHGKGDNSLNNNTSSPEGAAYSTNNNF